MAVCYKCGAENDSSFEVCCSCGERLELEYSEVLEEKNADNSVEEKIYDSTSTETVCLDEDEEQEDDDIPVPEPVIELLPENFVDLTEKKKEISEEEKAERRQRIIDKFYMRMRWERKAWSIYEKVHLAFAIFFGIFSVLYMVLSFVAIDVVNVVMVVYTFAYFFVTAHYIALVLISNIARGKLEKYMEGLYQNCAPSVKRGTSVGMIVFMLFFNLVGVVFYIMNFVHAKKYKEEFEEINRLQLTVEHN